MLADTAFDAVRAWLMAANPGLLKRSDLQRLEARLDELGDLLDQLRARLEARHAAQAPTGGGTPPPPRP